MIIPMVLIASAAQTAPAALRPPEMPNIAPCLFDEPDLRVERKSGLPPEVLAGVVRAFAPTRIADAGEYFESTDVVSGKYPQARFLRAYFVRDTWFLWYERGGIALSRFSIAFIQMRDAETRTMVWAPAPGSLFVNNLCAGAKAYLLGARSAG